MSTQSKVLSLLTQTKPEKQKIPNRKLNQPVVRRSQKGDIGLEFELEGVNLLANGYFDGLKGSASGAVWQAKADGSLRNGGREYVLSVPCVIGEVDHLVNGLFDRFKAHGSTIQLSNRCSTHVHYNVGGLKVNQITSIIALWYLFEEPLIKWWGTERLRNHFCLSSKDEEGTVEAWEAFLKTGFLPETQGLKYSALNLLTIYTFGSIEFRAGGGVNNAKKALTWIKFLYSMCEYAKNTYPSPYQIAYDLSERGAETIFQAICNQCFGNEDNSFFREVYETVDDFQMSCMESFRNAQPFVMGFPWDEWLEEIEKEFVPNPFVKEKAKKSGVMFTVQDVVVGHGRPRPVLENAARNWQRAVLQREEEGNF